MDKIKLSLFLYKGKFKVNSKRMRENMTSKNGCSNHALAMAYERKLELLGAKKVLEYKLIENDRVMLMSVNDKEDTGRLVIPSFITELNKCDSDGFVGVDFLLKGCKYSEVYVNNKCGIEFDASMLCREMESKRLKVEFRYPGNVVNMMGMFLDCERLEELDISMFDTDNVIDMSDMFSLCKRLKKIDLKCIDTRNVVNMSWMFSGCKSLKRLDLSMVNTSNVKSMRGLFDDCEKLEELDISNFDTENVVDMSWMFSGCINLKKVDISSWNISKLKQAKGIFRNCSNLKLIYKRSNGIFGNKKYTVDNFKKLMLILKSKISYCNNKYISI